MIYEQMDLHETVMYSFIEENLVKNSIYTKEVVKGSATHTNIL